MSEFKFACPGCGQRIAATDEYTGYQINCPVCQTAITVPANPAAPAAAPSIAIHVPGMPPPPTPPAQGKLAVSALSSHGAPAPAAAPAAQPAEEAMPSIGIPLPGMPPPPKPPAQGKLAVSALSSHGAHAPAAAPAAPAHAAPATQMGSAKFQAHLQKKSRKSNKNLITGGIAVGVIVIAACIWAPAGLKKWKAGREAQAAAKEAALNPPPPAPPPELTVPEIWQKTEEAYKGLTSLSARASSISVMETAGGKGGAPLTQNVTADISLKLGRPDNFRIDLERQAGGATVSATGWSAGKGNFLKVADQQLKPPSRGQVLASTGTRGPVIMAGLFYGDLDSSGSGSAPEWTQTNAPPLPGAKCYILAGMLDFQNVVLWINKETFMIQQVQVNMDGKTNAAILDDAKIKEAVTAMNGGRPATAAEIAQYKTTLKSMSRVKGTITETYQGIQTNLNIALADFEPPPPPPPAGRGPGQGAPPQGGGRRRRG